MAQAEILAADDVIGSGRSILSTYCPDKRPPGPTASPDWLALWYSSFGLPARDPVVITRNADGQITGWLALTRRAKGPGGILREFCSTTNGHSRYSALWLLSSADTEDAGAMLDALLGQGGWDRLRLQGLPVGTLATVETAAAQLGLASDRVHSFENRVVSCDPQASPPARKFSAATLRSRRKQFRRLKALGPVRIEHVISRTELPQALALYRAAERSSWKDQLGEIIGGDGPVGRFYTALVASPGPLLSPAITLMRLNENVVAGLVTLRTAGTWTALKTFYDSGLAEYSPGTQLLYDLIETGLSDPQCGAIDLFSSWSQYDLLASNTVAYGDLVIWNCTPRPRLARVVRKALI